MPVKAQHLDRPRCAIEKALDLPGGQKAHDDIPVPPVPLEAYPQERGGQGKIEDHGGGNPGGVLLLDNDDVAPRPDDPQHLLHDLAYLGP